MSTKSNPFREASRSQPWRTAYEANAAAVWTVSAAASVGIGMTSPYPLLPFVIAAAISMAFALQRAYEASGIWNLRINLLGKGMLHRSTSQYLAKCDSDPNQLWLGLGFRWQKHHAQRLYDLRRVEHENIMPPRWYARLRGIVVDQQPADAAGQPYIHGVGDSEDDILLPFSLLEGNTLIIGTTGSGKSTLLRLIAAACIRRGDCVIVIDPKGDRSLRDTMDEACRLTPGREHDFTYFHMAFPSRSVRFDVMKNFDRVTSLASRISAQIPSKTGTDPFVAFGWRAVLVNALLLVTCGERPTIAKIRRNVEMGIEPILERALISHFSAVLPSIWREKARVYEELAKEGKIGKPSRTTSDRVAAFVEYYKLEVSSQFPLEALDAGINIYHHDRAHGSKMLQSLLPVLAMLDSGELGGLLSPKYDDVNDPRPIVDSELICEGRRVFYIGLDGLSDSVVAGAVGSIVVADLAAVAGARYNYREGAPPRITVLIDEAPEVVSGPFQQLASKGRGSGFTLFAASQTIPDYISRLGSTEKAMSSLGNFNNLVCLRVRDDSTAEFVSKQFGTVFIDSARYTLSTSSQSDSSVAAFVGGEGVSVGDQLLEVVPIDTLYELPNHQYFALLAGGRLYKGRQPVLSPG